MPPREDIVAVGFKTTTGASGDEQYEAGLNLLQSSGLSLVLANDTTTRRNMILTTQEDRLYDTTYRQEALYGLVHLVMQRVQLVGDQL